MVDSTLIQNRNDKLAENTSPILAKLGNIYKAIVITKTLAGENLIDPTGQGRVAAYIPSLGMSPETPRIFTHAKTGSMFHVPDKTGDEILVFFADANSTDDSYWFATVSDTVDIVAGGIKGNPHIDGSGIGEGAFVDTPVMKNHHDAAAAELDGAEIPNSAFNKILGGQGTFSDDLRGPTTTSSRRDGGYRNSEGDQSTQHSKVYGMKTSAGSSISMDDGSISDDGTIHPEQIKITTSSGSAITIDGGNDFIHIINSSGTGWIEIGASGEVNVYAKGSMNMRTQKDFNLRADKNINIEAGENINMRSIKTTKINTDEELHLRSKANQFLQSESTMNINVGINCVVTTGNNLELNGPEAPKSELILVSEKADIDENLESIILKDTIVSEMPSHEPFTRPHAKKLTTSDFAYSQASEEGLKNSGTK
jgi:hypothetical protein